MPYIDDDARGRMVYFMCHPHGRGPETAGELNYCITQLVGVYRQDHGDSYQTFNDIVGALDNAKDEFRRRVQHPYENRKRRENGDVYVPLDGDESHGLDSYTTAKPARQEGSS